MPASVHWFVPLAQMPGMPLMHAPPPPGLPSSGMPSQSSSSPLHISAPGVTSPSQWPDHMPSMHDSMPATQMPRSTVPAGPV